MTELHYIADDLGFDRDKDYSTGITKAPKEDWLADADVDLKSGFEEMLSLEAGLDG